MRKSWNSLWAVGFHPVRIRRHKEQWTQFRQRDHACHRRRGALLRLILDWWILLPSETSKEYVKDLVFGRGGGINLLLINHYSYPVPCYLFVFIHSFIRPFFKKMYMLRKLKTEFICLNIILQYDIVIANVYKIFITCCKELITSLKNFWRKNYSKQNS